jgi:hypothetical protein
VSIVLESIKLGYHNVSETGSAPVLRCIQLGGGKVKKIRKVKWYKTYTVGSLRKVYKIRGEGGRLKDKKVKMV